MLVAGQFGVTLEFYRTLLGLPFQGEPPYAECRTGSSLLSILDSEFVRRARELDLPLGTAASPTSQTLICVEVDDLEDTFERLVVAGVRFLTPPSDRIPLGRRYAFLRDPDGRTVALLGPRTTPTS